MPDRPTGGIDVAAARAATPGCAHVCHLNHAGASLMPAAVLSAVVSHLELESTVGGYEAAGLRADSLDGVRTSAARLLSAEPHEIALVESATHAWTSAVGAITFEPGDRILLGRCEYISNVIALVDTARRSGASIEVVPDNIDGTVSLEALAGLLDDRVRMVAVTHAPTDNGLINPAVAIGELLRDHRALYVLDACQSVGQVDIDVKAIGCDVLTTTGRKFLRGPRGTGLLYVRTQALPQLRPRLPDLQAATWTAALDFELADDARRFETWECSVAGRLGLGAAIDHALGWGLAHIENRVQGLGEQLRDRLREVGATVHDRGRRRSGIVTFTVQGRTAAEVQDLLRSERINVSVSPSGWNQLESRPDLVRASVHYVTTTDELDHLVSAVMGSAR